MNSKPSYSTKSLGYKKLEEINADIDNNYKFYEQGGLLAGLSGIALFKFYYGKFTDNPIHNEIGTQILVKCLDIINNGFNLSTYCGGLAGIGWAFDHLQQYGFIENDNDNLLSDLDIHLKKIMISDIADRKYDFLHNALGYGYYFLNRYQNTKREDLRQRYKSYLLELIEHLDAIAVKNNNTYKWLSFFDNPQKTEQFNLSLSHGMSSIINFSSKLYRHDDFKGHIEPIITGAIRFVLSLKNQTAKGKSIFPDKVANRKPLDYPSRMAWCYGDLGVAVSLWSAYKALKNDELGTIAIEVLKKSSFRRSTEETMVMDAGICHGSFGIAQIYNRMFHETLKNWNKSENVFNETAEFWIHDGLNRAIPSKDYAGFREYKSEQGFIQGSHNILTGTSGIGLSLMSYLSNKIIDWDKCLLLS